MKYLLFTRKANFYFLFHFHFYPLNKYSFNYLQVSREIKYMRGRIIHLICFITMSAITIKYAMIKRIQLGIIFICLISIKIMAAWQK